MNIRNKTLRLVLLAVLAGILLLMSVTPLGYLTIGPVSITFNMIPVAIGAVILGPAGGAVLGFVFGLTSFLSAAGIVGTSALGTFLFAINPLLTAAVCFIPRTLMGALVGLICKGMSKVVKPKLPVYATTGFLSAILNTLFFMGGLVLLFAPSLHDAGWWKEGINVIVFVAGFVGVNALIEAAAATVITAAVGYALYRAKLVQPVTANAKMNA